MMNESDLSCAAVCHSNGVCIILPLSGFVMLAQRTAPGAAAAAVSTETHNESPTFVSFFLLVWFIRRESYIESR